MPKQAVRRETYSEMCVLKEKKPQATQATPASTTAKQRHETTKLSSPFASPTQRPSQKPGRSGNTNLRKGCFRHDLTNVFFRNYRFFNA